MMLDASSSDIEDLTGDYEHKLNLNRLLKTAKFKLIGLNSSFIRKLNRTIFEEFNLNVRSDEKTAFSERNRNYQTINQPAVISVNDEQTDELADQFASTTNQQQKEKKFRPKKHLIRLFETLHFKNGLYEQLRSTNDEKATKKKKKRKLIKKIKKITMDVCANLSGGVEILNGSYGYPSNGFDFNPNYDYHDSRSMYINYNGYDFNYNSTIIYGPRYI